MRNIVMNKVADYAQQNEKVFVVTGDSGCGVLDGYQKQFPDRYLNLGIAEQNMISFSAGLSLSGYKVFVYNIIPFLLYRCYEQVRNDICYQQLPVTLIGIGSGVTYAPQGMTHYAIEDIGLARTLSNLVILSPCDPIEAQAAIEFAFESDKPVYIRLAKSLEPTFHTQSIKDIRKPQILQEGSQVAVLFHGSISEEVMTAVKTISPSPLVISVAMIQPIDFDALAEMLKNIHTIITIEEHFVDGGLGSVIAEWIVKNKHSFVLKKLGICNEFLHQVKNTMGMRNFYGLSACHIKKTIEEALK